MQTIYESKTTNFCYVPFPKNASTWGNHVFGNVLSFQKKLWFYDPSKHYIVIIRDPLDKWFAGITQYIWQSRFDADIEEYLHNDFLLDPLHFEMIYTKISFDAHSMGQTRYIREYVPGLDRAKITYFYFNDLEFKNNISHFIYKRFNKVVPMDKRNDSSKNIFRTKVRKQIEFVYNTNTRYKEFIDDYLKEDYDFIKTLKFYKAASVSPI